MTGSEAIVRCLEGAGVEYVFGLSGHANLSMLDALMDSRVRFIAVRHEQNAAHMADAYYRFSHKPAAVLTTVGPGLANAVTGILEAALDSSAVVVISGNVPSYMIGREAFQELAVNSDAAQSEIFRPFVKRTWRVADSSSLTFVMQRAFNYALAASPGPVVVDVPMNYFSEVHDFEIPEMTKHLPTGTRIRGDLGEIERAVELLIKAERPLIHAGNGTLLSDASQMVVELAEHLAIPVSTSQLAQGVIDSSHPLAAGHPGVIGTITGNWAAREADVVLALGTRFSELETSSWDSKYSFGFGTRAKLIQVDLDAHQIGKAYPVEVGIVGDIRAVIDEMLVVAKDRTSGRPWSDRAQIQELHLLAAAWEKERDGIWSSNAVPIRVERVFKALASTLLPGTIVAVDAGTFRHGVGPFLPVHEAHTWHLPSGLGTMGGVMGASLGIKLAAPNRPVVALVGDGGFISNVHALATAKEAKIPVVWIVLNNYAHDSIRAYQHIHYESRVFGTEFVDGQGQPWNPDFVKLSECFGVPGVRVDRPEELEETLERAFRSGGAYTVEVRVAPTRLKGTGHWDIADILRQEGTYKRNRRSNSVVVA